MRFAVPQGLTAPDVQSRTVAGVTFIRIASPFSFMFSLRIKEKISSGSKSGHLVALAITCTAFVLFFILPPA
jgi:hypothetical protein